MSEPFLGEIRMVGFTFAPRDWADCDGTLLAISSNQALFALLGTTYGGDGRTTFALPDLRGRLPMHFGTGPGLTPRTMGQRGGTETNTLTETQMPAHNHGVKATNLPANKPGPGGKYLAGNMQDLGDGEFVNSYTNTSPVPEDNVKMMAGDMIQNSGGGQAQNNIQPYLVIRFVIALEGIFPSRN